MPRKSHDLEPAAAGLRRHPDKEGIGADVEPGAVIAAEAAVAAGHLRIDAGEQFSVWRDEMHAARAGRPDVARDIGLQTIGQAAVLLHHRGRIVEEAGWPESAVDIHWKRLPDRGLRVRLGHVERLLIGAQRDTVWKRHFLGEQGHAARGRDPVDAVPGDLAGLRVLRAFGESIGWIGEIDGAPLVDRAVVGAVEPLAVDGVGERSLATTAGEYRNPPVAVLAGDQFAGCVDGQTVAPLLAAVAWQAGVAAGLEEHSQTRALLPLIDFVPWHIREDDKPTAAWLSVGLREPDRALAPVEARGEHLNRGIGRQECIGPGVEPDDLAHRWPRRQVVGGGAAGGHAEKHEAGESNEPPRALTSATNHKKAYRVIMRKPPQTITQLDKRIALLTALSQRALG